MIKTSGVLAGAYKDQSLKVTLSHRVEYGLDGWAVRVLCKRARLENMAAEHESDASDDAPTCTVCARKRV